MAKNDDNKPDDPAPSDTATPPQQAPREQLTVAEEDVKLAAAIAFTQMPTYDPPLNWGRIDPLYDEAMKIKKSTDDQPEAHTAETVEKPATENKEKQLKSTDEGTSK